MFLARPIIKSAHMSLLLITGDEEQQEERLWRLMTAKLSGGANQQEQRELEQLFQLFPHMQQKFRIIAAWFNYKEPSPMAMPITAFEKHLKKMNKKTPCK
jgi:hypothetical protein